MKTRMIMLTAGLALVVMSCQQEQENTLTTTFDINISFDADQVIYGEDNYLYLTMENISSSPAGIPDGMIVLEFTSYSGSIKRNVPLQAHNIKVEPDWKQYKEYVLQSGEKINLRINLNTIIYGGDGQSPAGIPGDGYAINAYLTAERNMEDLTGVEKLRSNYLYLDILADPSQLSYY